ncbi:hypothetical protein M5K25_028227 [Dendrobium thyrsiflorum]|uniref:Uncharacterized protein n=1 Tax=Dendrobium thyrsiflorum TaxID=117978 RepID=A0ABD0TTP9_DENTH
MTTLIDDCPLMAQSSTLLSDISITTAASDATDSDVDLDARMASDDHLDGPTETHVNQLQLVKFLRKEGFRAIS